MHKTTHFFIEVNSQVVNLQCPDFQPCIKCASNFSLGERKNVNGYWTTQKLSSDCNLLTPDYHTLSDDFKGNRSLIICLILETKFRNDPKPKRI